MSTPSKLTGEKTALVISNFFNDRYTDIQSLSQKIKAECRKRPHGSNSLSNAYSKRRRSRSYCRYHQRRFDNVKISKKISFTSPLNATHPKSSRQNSYRQLATHKWHAKRFRMMKRWGCVLAQSHLHRGRSFLWNALKKHCVIHDKSYLVTVALDGTLHDISVLIAKLMDPLKAEICLKSIVEQAPNTIHEHRACLYHSSSFPQHCIGPATFFLTPTEYSDSEALSNRPRTILLWIHPAMHSDVLLALANARSDASADVQISSSGQDHFKTGAKSVKFSRISVMGSQSSSLISRVIKPLLSSDTGNDDAENGEFFDKVLKYEGINKVWMNQEGLSMEVIDCRELRYLEKGAVEIREENPYQTWHFRPNSLHVNTTDTASVGVHRKRKLSAPKKPVSSSFFHSPVDLTVDDAALNLHRHQQRGEAYSVRCTNNDNESPNWSSHNDTHVHDVDRSIRSRLRFSVLLVRKSSNVDMQLDDSMPLHFGGWDIIVQEQHCRNIWLALNYAGGRSIGMDEWGAIENAMKISHFPRDYPDTAAGFDYWKGVHKLNKNLNRKRPFRKRAFNACRDSIPKLKKLFNFNGKTEANKCSPMDMVVMRNPVYAEPFFPSQYLRPNKVREALNSVTNLKFSDTRDCSKDVRIPEFPFPTLVRVYVASSGRGVPMCGALLFQPLPEDYDNFLEFRKHRSDRTTSNNRRVGEWIGSSSSEMEVQRNHLGIATSAIQPHLFTPERSCIAFCEAGNLCKTISMSMKYIVRKVKNRAEGFPLPLIMFRNPYCDTFRPALFQICLA